MGKNILPYCDVPETKEYLNHLFDYNKPYVLFTSNFTFEFSSRYDYYTLAILTFTKSLSSTEY